MQGQGGRNLVAVSFPGDCGFLVAGLITYFPDASCRIEASFL